MDVSFHVSSGPLNAETQVVEAVGELDRETAPYLETVVGTALDTGARFVVLDLGEVWFVDSAALAVMLAVHRRLEERGGRLVTVCSDPLVARLFETSGLTQSLNVTASRREALSQAQHFAPAC